jgi:hypothetical protein
MSLKLRNRKAAEAQLGQFVEDISLAPKLISAIVDGEVRFCEAARCKAHGTSHPAVARQTNEAYVQYLVQLHNKLEFSTSKARC